MFKISYITFYIALFTILIYTIIINLHLNNVISKTLMRIVSNTISVGLFSTLVYFFISQNKIFSKIEYDITHEQQSTIF